ncbi:hypothetical protein GCM10027275_37030 [Rhabdobacter roseus]|uniref:Rhodanese-related sulfurtransferase n=1 Tax=Rhabdobacter roseus TaxID=1655419 RepID=A0A840U190_9BACT|nr:rhodanese-like domain-containing protein [Rhabdobacter roseus]MBB5285890.1 rhodanese-related sulfurtransferase [Rhabdobacter roseus]
MKPFLYITSILFLFSGTGLRAQTNIDLPPADFEKAIQAEGIQLWDVRRPDEFAQGHIRGATLVNWEDKAQFEAHAQHLDKNETVYVYCRSGKRSRQAADWLQEKGFIHVVNLEGGLLGWKEQDKPIAVNPSAQPIGSTPQP